MSVTAQGGVWWAGVPGRDEASLRDFRRTLNEHLAACDQALASSAEPACPTIEALDEPERASRRHGEKVAI